MMYCDGRVGGIARFLVVDRSRFMRVPEDILKCVVFVLGSSDEQKFVYLGTGFLIACTSELHPPASYVYAVTARHVIRKAEHDGQGVYLCLNTKNGPAMRVKISSPWTFPDDEGCDLAVVPLTLPVDQFDYKYVSDKMLATESVISKHNIGVGDDLIISGLFANHAGKERILPIVRQGILAAMDDEPMADSASGLTYRAYLAEVRSIGGLLSPA